MDNSKIPYLLVGVKAPELGGQFDRNTQLKDKFPTEKQFLSWLNVVPDNDISGGKVLKSRVKRKKIKPVKLLEMLQILFGILKIT